MEDERKDRDADTPEAEPVEYVSEWAEKAAALSERAWTWVQCALGLGLGLAGGLLFALQDSPEFGFFALPAAALVLLLGPRALENQLQRSLQKGRITMICTFALALVFFLIRSRGS